MVHFTNKDIMKKRHYWRLDSKTITMFKVHSSGDADRWPCSIVLG
jgi:protein kinase D